MFKDKYMLVVAIAILVELFLLIIGNNIPPGISKLSLLWLSSLVVFQPKIFLSNSFIVFYFYILLYSFLILYGFYNLPFDSFLREEILPLFLAISIFNYFKGEKDNRTLGLLCLLSLIFLGITAVVTNFVYLKYPLASRELSSMGFSISSAIYQRSNRLGVADYGILSGVTFLIPSLIGAIRTGDLEKRYRTGLIAITAVLVLMLLRSTYSSFVLFVAIGIGFAFVSNRDIKKNFIILGFIFLIIYFFPRHILSDGITWMANQFEVALIKERLMDLAITIRKGVNMSDTHFSYRAARIPLLLNNFAESPLIGKGIILTGHVYWLDRLAGFGIVGLIPIILLFWYQIRYSVENISSEELYFFIISYFLFITYGLMKGYGNSKMFTIVFFIIPSLGYLKYALPLNIFNQNTKSPTL